MDFFTDESIKLYIDRDILSLTKQWKSSADIPPKSFVKSNNSYNIGNLELIKYFINSSNHQVVGHSAFNDNGVFITLIIFYKKWLW